MKFTTKILESTGLYSNVEVSIDMEANTIPEMVEQVCLIQEEFRKKYGPISETSVSRKVSTELKARTDFSKEQEMQPTGAGETLPSCKCGSFPDKKVSKAGKPYLVCPECKSMSFDQGKHWSTPAEMEAFKKGKK